MDITRWLEEEERDLLFLVTEAYGEFTMSEHTESYVRLFTGMHRAEKQYTNPLQVGMTVRIVGEEYHGQVGEIKVIEPSFYGVYLDSVEDTVFFLRDEIERVEDIDMAELPF